MDIPNEAELHTLSVDHRVVVTNTGHRASPVVVLAFILATPDSPQGITPIKRLFDFTRINNLQPGENVTVNFASDAGSLGICSAVAHSRLPLSLSLSLSRARARSRALFVCLSVLCVAHAFCGAGVVDEAGRKLLMAGRYRIEIGSVTAPAVRDVVLRGESVVVEQNGWAQAMATGRWR